MAASLAVHPRVREEVEKTIAYKPDEVCAYRFLAECSIETGHPGKAEYWYEKAISIEPLMFDRDIWYRIQRIKIDSLFNAGNYEQVIVELDTFLQRVETVGNNTYWDMTRLYLKLGTAYNKTGNTEKAIRVWRTGIDTRYRDYLYYDNYAVMIAESLVVYDSTFTQDSLSVLQAAATPYYFHDSIGIAMRLVVQIMSNFALWFIIGAIIVLGSVINAPHADTQENVTTIPRTRWNYVAIMFLACILAPSVLVPVIIALTTAYTPGYVLPFIIAGTGGAVTGILLVLLDSVRQARSSGLSLTSVLKKTFLPLWLSLAVFLALVLTLIIMFAGIVAIATFV
jgi:hypothetical protein